MLGSYRLSFVVPRAASSLSPMTALLKRGQVHSSPQQPPALSKEKSQTSATVREMVRERVEVAKMERKQM